MPFDTSRPTPQRPDFGAAVKPRGTVPAEIWGRDGYGGLTGLMATPVLLADFHGEKVDRMFLVPNMAEAALLSLVGIVALAELCGQQSEHGAHPLAASLHEVAAGDIRDLVGEGHRGEQPRLDLRETFLDGVDEPTLITRGEQLLAEPEGRAQRVAAASKRNARFHVTDRSV